MSGFLSGKAGWKYGLYCACIWLVVLCVQDIPFSYLPVGTSFGGISMFPGQAFKRNKGNKSGGKDGDDTDKKIERR